jgi:hypothetical protein
VAAFKYWDPLAFYLNSNSKFFAVNRSYYAEFVVLLLVVSTQVTA